jgi:hypothetical protein
MSDYTSSETAAIDRWIEPATEPVYTCRKCGHEPDVHDEYGCYDLITDPQDHDDIHCDCKGFE